MCIVLSMVRRRVNSASHQAQKLCATFLKVTKYFKTVRCGCGYFFNCVYVQYCDTAGLKRNLPFNLVLFHLQDIATGMLGFSGILGGKSLVLEIEMSLSAA